MVPTNRVVLRIKLITKCLECCMMCSKYVINISLLPLPGTPANLNWFPCLPSKLLKRPISHTRVTWRI